MVRTEFLADEKLAKLTPQAIIFLLGASSLADPNGVLENRPLRVKVAAMPHSSIDPDQIIGELIGKGLVLVSKCGRFLRIIPFQDWFKSYPNESFFPVALEDFSGTTVERSHALPMLVPCISDAPSKTKDKPKNKTKTKPTPEPKETLTAILAEVQHLIGDDDYDATGVYWGMMGLWLKDKNPAPTQTAKALRDALGSGATIDDIYGGAEKYRAEFDDQKFMIRPLVWLQNEGWATYAANQ